MQDTGFSRVLPTSEGLLTFRDESEALAGCRALDRDYAFHAKRAREIAEQFFDSDLVLTDFLEKALP